ncbi:hypothetical protein LCGC14_0548830 [marine sediment metagenome]|uniref:Uncharacterized protein n=1 Tax=marine sediment metagenome TaxID=412755 RepID=A0A0F9UYX5_9ZZZZ
MMIPPQEINRLEYLANMFNMYDYPEVAHVVTIIKQGLDASLLDYDIKQSIIATKNIASKKDIPTIEICDT